MAKVKHTQIDDYQLAEIVGLVTALGLKADKTQINGNAGRFVKYGTTGLAESTKLFEGTNGLGIGFGTDSGITHPITMNVGSTGIAFYTNNDGTNYRRFIIRENGGNLSIISEAGGTGTLGGMIFDVAGNQLIVSPSQGDSGAVRSLSSATQPGANQIVVAGTQTGTTGRTYGWAYRSTINKSGDSSFGCILVSPLLTSFGTGEKILVDLGTNTVAAGGVSPVHTSVFRVLLDQIITSIPFNSTSTGSFTGKVTVAATPTNPTDVVRLQDLPVILTTTATLDFPSTAAGMSSDLTVPLTGAVLGDVVALGTPFSATLANSSYSVFVSAADTVTVRFNNYSVAAVNPASGTFKIKIFK